MVGRVSCTRVDEPDRLGRAQTGGRDRSQRRSRDGDGRDCAADLPAVTPLS